MKPRVELIYDVDCPNAAGARSSLLKAFAIAGMTPRWIEWDRKAAESPDYVRRYGSPTVLVDGRDVAGAKPDAGADCCRLYEDEQHVLRGAPSLEALTAALRQRAGQTSLLKKLFLALPGIGALLAPVGVCPFCWPVYLGLLASTGLAFLNQEKYLMPIAALLIAIGLAPLAYRARQNRNYGALLLAVAGAAGAFIGKFLVPIAALLYGGLGLLVGASLWPARRRGSGSTEPCRKCVPTRHPQIDHS